MARLEVVGQLVVVDHLQVLGEQRPARRDHRRPRLVVPTVRRSARQRSAWPASRSAVGSSASDVDRPGRRPGE